MNVALYPSSMQRSSWVGLFCLLIAASVSIVWGLSLARDSSAGMADFKAIYYASRCVLEHHDPYKPDEFLRLYARENGQFPSDLKLSPLFIRAVPICINLPTALFLAAPWSLMPWSVASMLWFAFASCGLIAACFLAWDLSRPFAPRLSLLLLSFVASNCETLLKSGNLAGVAIAFCVIAVWCFLRNRFLPIGIVCFAVSLSLKPQDAGLVWLLFLLLRSTYRKLALSTLAVTAIIGLVSLLWISSVSPHWAQELRSNIAITSARGDLSDPGPASSDQRSTVMIIDLRTVISIVDDNPRVYTAVSLLIVGALLGPWAVKAFRQKCAYRQPLLALATVVPLSMLPIYHRFYDAKLLLLSIPACSMLFVKKGWVRTGSLILTGLALLLTGDIPAAVIDGLTRTVPKFAGGVSSGITTILLLRQVPLILLALGIFNLSIYLREPWNESEKCDSDLSCASDTSIAEHR